MQAHISSSKGVKIDKGLLIYGQELQFKIMHQMNNNKLLHMSSTRQMASKLFSHGWVGGATNLPNVLTKDGLGTQAKGEWEKPNFSIINDDGETWAKDAQHLQFSWTRKLRFEGCIDMLHKLIEIFL